MAWVGKFIRPIYVNEIAYQCPNRRPGLANLYEQKGEIWKTAGIILVRN